MIPLFFHQSFLPDLNVSELLVSLGGASDEYYPAAAVATLMRVLRDPLLSNHHKDAIQVHNVQIN